MPEKSGIFSRKMSDVIVSPPAKFKLPVLFRVSTSKEWRQGDNTDKLDSFLTMQSRKKGKSRVFF